MRLEESDHQRVQFQRRRVSGKGKEDSNEALSVDQSSKSKKGKGHGHGHKHADVTCWNCDEKGHISRYYKKLKRSQPKDDLGRQGGNGKMFE
jgi:hypothetical protein